MKNSKFIVLFPTYNMLGKMIRIQFKFEHDKIQFDSIRPHKSMIRIFLFATFTFPWYGKPSLKYFGVYGRNFSFRAWCTTTVRLIVVSTMPVPVSVKLAIRTILFGATFHWASPSTAPDSTNSVQPSGESSCNNTE